jgi:hypothetical protein
MDHISVTGADIGSSNIALLTEGAINGAGIFDTLIRTVKLHLQEEYDQGRISGKEYSTVYLGALAAVLQQSVSYMVANKEMEKSDAVIGLTRQQIVTELAKTDDTIPELLAFNSTTAVAGLMGQEQDINAQKILSAIEEVAKAKDERALLGQKIVTELALTDNSLVGANTEGYGFNSSNTIAGTIALEKLKISAETTLLTHKSTTEVDSDLLVQKEITKATAEIALLNQKTVSEVAQTVDGSVTGVIGKQKELFAAQTAGFARDAEQKLLKIMIDPLVARIAGDSGILSPTNLNNNNLNVAIAKAMTGIAVTPVA